MIAADFGSARGAEEMDIAVWAEILFVLFSQVGETGRLFFSILAVQLGQSGFWVFSRAAHVVLYLSEYDIKGDGGCHNQVACHFYGF